MKPAATPIFVALLLPLSAIAQDDGAESRLISADEVSYTVYSQTAAELFWERRTGEYVQYEVSIDGVPVEVTDGVSYFTDSLAPGTTYRFGITAIGPDSTRSDIVTLTINTDSLRPNGPQNLRLDTYSSTAAELFWERFPASDSIARVIVRRDGDVIGDTDGISYYDDTRTPDTNHVYELVAVATDGSRSNAVRISDGSATSLAGDDSSLPGSDTSSDSPYPSDHDIIKRVASIIQGAQYARAEEVAAQLLPLINLPSDVAVTGFSRRDPVASPTSGESTATSSLYGCDGGGTVLVEHLGTHNARFDLSACTINASTVNGLVSASTGAGLTLAFEPLEIIGDDGESLLWTGIRDSYRAATATLSAGLERSASRFQTSSAENGVTTLENAIVDFAISDRGGRASVERRLSARFIVTADWTNGDPVSVATSEDFTNLSEADYYSTGKLVIQFEDGRTVALDASTADPGTFLLTSSPDGSIDTSAESSLIPWSDATRLPCFTDEGGIGGCTQAETPTTELAN